MIASNNQPSSHEGRVLSLASNIETVAEHHVEKSASPVARLNSPSPLLLPQRLIMHNPQAGINPLVDAAAYLLSIAGKLRQVKNYRQLKKLHQELVHELNVLQETIQTQGYNPEYVAVCRYILCATFNDIIENTAWGGQGGWKNYCLLTAFNQDTQHHEKFFAILDRAAKDPAQYIDLMELIYLCLSLGYKGQYRATEHSQYQLEQITHHLYQHIRAYRGNISKTLSPTLKLSYKRRAVKQQKPTPLLLIFLLTTCIIMAIFISLSYIMDVISNEAYKSTAEVKPTLTQPANPS